MAFLVIAIATLPAGCRSVGPAGGTTGPVLDPDATLVELYSDERFFEGPLWSPREGRLYFTAFGKDGQQILRLERPGVVHVWMDKTEGINGTHRSRNGRMLAAQVYGHRVLSLALGGAAPSDTQALAADPNWNQPNDVCEAPNGDIYFTDPNFKAHHASAVYRLRPDALSVVPTGDRSPAGAEVGDRPPAGLHSGSHRRDGDAPHLGDRPPAGAEVGDRPPAGLHCGSHRRDGDAPHLGDRPPAGLVLLVERIITDMAVPNGLVVSSDGRTLYVADSFHKHWRAYPIAADGMVGPGRVFFDPVTDNHDDPDGMTIDERGNLYLSGRGGIWIVRPDGTLLEFIRTPVFCSNVCFGGPDGRTLFITGKGKVFALATNVRGVE